MHGGFKTKFNFFEKKDNYFAKILLNFGKKNL